MAYYRKIPVVIEAIIFDGTESSGAHIAGWASVYDVKITYHPFLADHFKGDPTVYVAHPDPYLLIETLEGNMSASVGDFVIRGVSDEFYPCKPDIFAVTYERFG
jgi:hypothetical protein